jgi:hypothetical protein
MDAPGRGIRVFPHLSQSFHLGARHVEGACDFAVKHPERILMLQYEEMLKNASAGARHRHFGFSRSRL